MSRDRILRRLLATTAAIAGVVLVVRAWYGPFSLGLSVRSPMNVESILAAALVLLVLLSPREQTVKTDLTDGTSLNRRDWLALAAVFCTVVVILWPSFSVGFLADDYYHILRVSKAHGSFFRELFTVPAVDRFFRPLGIISYWIDYHWAGFSTFRWHLAGVLLHACSTLLVFVLCRRLGLTTLWAAFAAVVFGVHGTRPEAVTWVSSRFDLLATLFALTAILLFLEYVQRPTPARLLLLLAATVCGLLSKESAYVLPLMLTEFVALRRELRKRAAYRAIAAVAALTAGVFIYRWVLLHGIGGYVDGGGRPTILLIHSWLIVKALALRLWAVLFFPLNWTDPLGWLLKITLLFAIAALIVLGARARFSRLAGLGLLLTLISALPVQHLLLIGPDLEKSRVVYLGSAGFALFLAATLQTSQRRLAYAAAAGVLSFQVAALWHNLATWERVSRVHERACDVLAGAAGESQAGVIAVGMPNTYDGVYMLKTGLPECVEIRHGIPGERLHRVATMAEAGSVAGGLPLFRWDEEEARVEKVR